MTIYEQLENYCDCLTKAVDDEATPLYDGREVDELINLISTYTCWATHPCETFLMSERREVIDVKDCKCDCDIFEFEPFFTPFDPDSFEFTLVEQNGLQENLSPISSYVYSEADGKFRLELPLPACKCRPRCGCKPKYKLVATYMAGYEGIPECLLPLFCEALKWIIERNKCDCEACQDCENEYAHTKEIDYTSLKGRLQEHFLTVLSTQYFRQLSLISLCQRRHNLWGIVV